MLDKLERPEAKRVAVPSTATPTAPHTEQDGEPTASEEISQDKNLDFDIIKYLKTARAELYSKLKAAVWSARKK